MDFTASTAETTNTTNVVIKYMQIESTILHYCPIDRIGIVKRSYFKSYWNRKATVFTSQLDRIFVVE